MSSGTSKRALIFLVALCVAWSHAAPAEPPPIEIRAMPAVDENLFLVRLLETYYASIPDTGAKREEVSAWLASTRQGLGSVRGIISARHLDRDVDDMYADGLQFVAAYESYLTAVGAIERQRPLQVASDLFAGVLNGLQNKSDAESMAKKLGVADDNAAGIGKVVGVLGGLNEVYQRNNNHAAQATAALEAQQRSLNDVWSRVSSRAQLAGRMLTERYGWGPGEAGFDGFQSRYLLEYIKRRPRDPFARILYARSTGEKETPADLIERVRFSIDAAELVPVDAFYDDFRKDFIAEGTDLAVLAAAVEGGKGGYSAAPPSAAAVLVMSRTYLSLDPQDPTGRGYAALARGLAFSGRYVEAVTAATTALNRASQTWNNDPFFCYRYALMLSLAGGRSVELVGGWLRQAYDKGMTRVDFIRDNPDLANYRRTYPADYALLTTVAVTHKVSYGSFFGDVVFTNRSPFPITKLRATVTVRKGRQEWSAHPSCDYVPPGGSCRQDNAVEAGPYDFVSAEYDCEQLH